MNCLILLALIVMLPCPSHCINSTDNTTNETKITLTPLVTQLDQTLLPSGRINWRYKMTTVKQLNAAANNQPWDISSLILSGETNAMDTLAEQGHRFANVQAMENEPLYLAYWVSSIEGLLSSDAHSVEVVKYFSSIGIEA